MQSPLKAAEGLPVSVEEAWSELERELAVRRRCFDDWVSAGKLSWADARDRYARMVSAARHLRKLCDIADTALPPDSSSPHPAVTSAVTP